MHFFAKWVCMCVCAEREIGLIQNFSKHPNTTNQNIRIWLMKANNCMVWILHIVLVSLPKTPGVSDRFATVPFKSSPILSSDAFTDSLSFFLMKPLSMWTATTWKSFNACEKKNSNKKQMKLMRTSALLTDSTPPRLAGRSPPHNFCISTHCNLFGGKNWSISKHICQWGTPLYLRLGIWLGYGSYSTLPSCLSYPHLITFWTYQS